MSSSSTSDDRRQRAIDAAVTVAERFGIPRGHPAILKDSNNTIVHLAPSAVVAKVGTTPSTRRTLRREVSVAQYLKRRAAPVVSLTSLLPAGPHQHDGMNLTFWRFCPHQDGVEADGYTAGQSLLALHRGFAGYPGALPPFTNDLDEAGGILAQPDTLMKLSEDKRAVLRTVYEEVRPALAKHSYAVRPLHGEAHLGNLLLSPDGPKWIDFEAACFGPSEWDLGALPDEAAASYPNVDVELLRLLRRIHSLCVAV